MKNQIDIWLLGNTGMRNPWRIQGGFKVYYESNQVGKIRTPEEQLAFKKLLYSSGEIGGSADKDQSASITRKYRLMFNRYGFAYPEIKKSYGFSQLDIGQLDTITPLGEMFYEADTVSKQQDCFLRAMSVPMYDYAPGHAFSPLLWVISIMFALKDQTGSYKIDAGEFALFVQTSTPAIPIKKVVNTILAYRNARASSESKKEFDKQQLDKVALHYPKDKNNFAQYSDMNIRYLIISGLIKHDGRGITLVEEREPLAAELLGGLTSTESLKERIVKLCSGVTLPTDTVEVANKVLMEEIAQLQALHIPITVPRDIKTMSAKRINEYRERIKYEVDKFKEEVYARKQRNQWEEILEYMNLLVSGNYKKKELDEDHVIHVPQDEASSYLEWIMWRAFLAIDHSISKPYESRGFKLDQDYLPAGHAPGGKPDIVFEFENYVIVIEVTLSSNSRQEAMEGEPVRRHVADVTTQYNKPVYGLFIANTIDSNTADTFYKGTWYLPGDRRVELDIVPLTLQQFSYFFKHIFVVQEVHPDRIIELFRLCLAAKQNRSAAEWKARIGDIISEECA